MLDLLPAGQRARAERLAIVFPARKRGEISEYARAKSRDSRQLLTAKEIGLSDRERRSVRLSEDELEQCYILLSLLRSGDVSPDDVPLLQPAPNRRPIPYGSTIHVFKCTKIEHMAIYGRLRELRDSTDINAGKL